MIEWEPYKCLGQQYVELINKKGVVVSKSSQKAFEEYKKDAAKILGSDPLRGINWGKKLNSYEVKNFILRIDNQEKYIPMAIEVAYWSYYHEQNKEQELFYRDKDNELSPTDKGVELYTKRLQKTLMQVIEALVKRRVKKPKTLLTDWDNRDDYLVIINNNKVASYPIGEIGLFFHILEAGGLIYCPKFFGMVKNEKHKLEIAHNAINAFEALRKNRIKDKKYTECYQKTDEEIKAMLAPFYKITGNRNALKMLNETQHGMNVATTPVIARALDPMLNGSLWKFDEMGQLYYTALNQKKTQEITYIIAPRHKGFQETVKQGIPCEEAWAIVKNLGIETAILHILFAGYCLANETPQACHAQARGDDLIKLLHLDKRTITENGKKRRLTREEQLELVRNYVQSLGDIFVKIAYKTTGFPHSGTIYEPTLTPLWGIYIKPCSQLSFPGIDKDNLSDFEVYIRAGDWIMGEKGQREHLYYSYISKNILDFDYNTEEWALKLAIYTSIYAGQDRQHTFKVETLLKEILPHERIEHALTGTDKKAKRDRYEITTSLINHLNILEKRGWKVTKSKEFLKATKTSNPGGRRPKGFFEQLLDSTLTFTVPSPTSPKQALKDPGQEEQKHLALPAKRKGATPKKEENKEPNTQTITGKAFKEQRLRLGLSQKEVAHLLGLKGNSLVSMIERGKRNLPKKLMPKWEEIIKKRGGDF